MPATIYYDDDADLGLLEGRKVAVLGYGSQGHAHALNLKDSGVDVRVGLREGSTSWAKAEEAGLRVLHHRRGGARKPTSSWCCSPTPSRRGSTRTTSSRTSTSGDSLAFAHGFNIHFGQITPPKGVDVWMIAPKGPGHLVRRTYEEGGGVPCARRGRGRRDRQGEADRARVREGRSARTRAGVLDTTFEEETETDLFGEQVVLCGGLVELIKASYETLVEAGYQPESAYFETLHEVKLIVDLIYEGGIANMRYSISDTAEYGDMTRGPRIVTDDDAGRDAARSSTRSRPASSPRSGSSRTRPAGPVFNALRAQVGASTRSRRSATALRSMMPWIGAGQGQAARRLRRLSLAAPITRVRRYALSAVGTS